MLIAGLDWPQWVIVASLTTLNKMRTARFSGTVFFLMITNTGKATPTAMAVAATPALRLALSTPVRSAHRHHRQPPFNRGVDQSAIRPRTPSAKIKRQFCVVSNRTASFDYIGPGPRGETTALAAMRCANDHDHMQRR
jgi:hypothetical protein